MKTLTRVKCVLFLLLLTSCFPEEKELSFDKASMKLAYCKNDSKIEKVIISVRAIDTDDRFERVQSIKLTESSEGSNYIILNAYNEGYDGIFETLLPNKEYRIDVPFLDNSSFITIETNEESEIIQVYNQFNCSKDVE